MNDTIHLVHNTEVVNQLNDLVDKLVTVWTGEGPDRTTFDPSISVNGKLEKHSEKDRFRIVVSEGCYCYINPSNVMIIAKHPGTFRDGSKAVIRISIDSSIAITEIPIIVKMTTTINQKVYQIIDEK